VDLYEKAGSARVGKQSQVGVLKSGHFHRRKVHVARSRRFVSSVDPSSKSVDSFGENIIQPHKIPSTDVFSEAAAFALLALAISVFSFFPRLFLLDSEVF
jgi:hypothetical protein